MWGASRDVGGQPEYQGNGEHRGDAAVPKVDERPDKEAGARGSSALNLPRSPGLAPTEIPRSTLFAPILSHRTGTLEVTAALHRFDEQQPDGSVGHVTVGLRSTDPTFSRPRLRTFLAGSPLDEIADEMKIHFRDATSSLFLLHKISQAIGSRGIGDAAEPPLIERSPLGRDGQLVHTRILHSPFDELAEGKVRYTQCIEWEGTPLVTMEVCREVGVGSDAYIVIDLPGDKRIHTPVDKHRRATGGELTTFLFELFEYASRLVRQDDWHEHREQGDGKAVDRGANANELPAPWGFAHRVAELLGVQDEVEAAMPLAARITLANQRGTGHANPYPRVSLIHLEPGRWFKRPESLVVISGAGAEGVDAEIRMKVSLSGEGSGRIGVGDLVQYVRHWVLDPATEVTYQVRGVPEHFPQAMSEALRDHTAQASGRGRFAFALDGNQLPYLTGDQAIAGLHGSMIESLLYGGVPFSGSALIEEAIAAMGAEPLNLAELWGVVGVIGSDKTTLALRNALGGELFIECECVPPVGAGGRSTTRDQAYEYQWMKEILSRLGDLHGAAGDILRRWDGPEVNCWVPRVLPVDAAAEGAYQNAGQLAGVWVQFLQEYRYMEREEILKALRYEASQLFSVEFQGEDRVCLRLLMNPGPYLGGDVAFLTPQEVHLHLTALGTERIELIGGGDELSTTWGVRKRQVSTLTAPSESPLKPSTVVGLLRSLARSSSVFPLDYLREEFPQLQVTEQASRGVLAWWKSALQGFPRSFRPRR